MNIIYAGSLLGVKVKRTHFSFSVGKVEIRYMYLLDFEEILFTPNEFDLIRAYKIIFS